MSSNIFSHLVIFFSMLVVKHGWTDHQLEKRIEAPLYASVWVLALLLAIIPLPLQWYNNAMNVCWVESTPYQCEYMWVVPACEDVPCTRGGKGAQSYTYATVAVSWTLNFLSLSYLAMIYVAVRKTENLQIKYVVQPAIVRSNEEEGATERSSDEAAVLQEAAELSQHHSIMFDLQVGCEDQSVMRSVRRSSRFSEGNICSKSMMMPGRSTMMRLEEAEDQNDCKPTVCEDDNPSLFDWHMHADEPMKQSLNDTEITEQDREEAATPVDKETVDVNKRPSLERLLSSSRQSIAKSVSDRRASLRNSITSSRRSLVNAANRGRQSIVARLGRTNVADSTVCWQEISHRGSRKVATQAYAYFMAYMLTYGLTLVQMVWTATHPDDYHNEVLFFLSYSVCLPLQGFWNCVVFSRNRPEMKTREGILFRKVVFVLDWPVWGAIYSKIESMIDVLRGCVGGKSIAGSEHCSKGTFQTDESTKDVPCLTLEEHTSSKRREETIPA